MNDDLKPKIRAKVIELARGLGHNASALKDDQEIPASGVLDSPALMELIMWFEGETGMEFDQDELTLENFGSIDAMVDYAHRSKP